MSSDSGRPLSFEDERSRGGKHDDQEKDFRRDDGRYRGDEESPRREKSRCAPIRSKRTGPRQAKPPSCSPSPVGPYLPRHSRTPRTGCRSLAIRSGTRIRAQLPMKRPAFCSKEPFRGDTQRVPSVEPNVPKMVQKSASAKAA